MLLTTFKYISCMLCHTILFIFSHHAGFLGSPDSKGVSLVAQLVKTLPAMCETWVLSLGWEDPLEKGKTSLCSILA